MLKQLDVVPNVAKKRVGSFLYLLGLLLGMLLSVLMIWGDLEASLFDVTFRAERQLNTLSCPVLLGADEVANVTATFHNNRDSDENVFVRAHISSGFVTLIREEETRITLPPNGSQTLSWSVSADDAAWDRIVLVRVGGVQRLPFPQLVGASCGIMMLPFSGLSGGTVLGLSLLASGLLLLAGGWMWGVTRRGLTGKEAKRQRQMIVAAGLLLASLLLGWFGQWLPGLGLLIAIVVYVASGMEQFAYGGNR